VTCVDFAYVPRVRQYFIAAGSKDYRITIWKFDAIKKQVDESKKDIGEILFGHHNEITAVKIEKTLGIVVSADKVNWVFFFDS
jgi:hypothetical protein